MRFLWATRGRTWGVRFLRDGGFADPLVEYDKAFAHSHDEPTACFTSDGRVALRFPDPLGRQDDAGRVILHEFVVDGTFAAEIHSASDGLRLIWPRVSEEFARVWDLPEPPASHE